MNAPTLPALTLKCSRCGAWKPPEEFNRDKNAAARGGRSRYCRPCAKELKRASYAASAGNRNPTPEQRVRRRASVARWLARGGTRTEFERVLMSQYGIGAEDWARMFERQSGACAGCLSPPKFDRHTHVDHDHTSGVVRGLLCSACNHALGGAKDCVETLRRLIAYLGGK